MLVAASALVGCMDGEVGDVIWDQPTDSGTLPDSGAILEDSGAAPDTTPPPDTTPVADTAPPPDTTPAADTEPPPDTAPPPPTMLPLPDMSKVVEAVGKAHPDYVARSCQNEGGTWELMDAIVDELRKTDKRWGYNWKRGVIGDPSHDAIDYHWGTGPSEGSKDVYIIDVVVGHCGPSPAVGWIDVTEATAKGGTIGIWTGRGRF